MSELATRSAFEIELTTENLEKLSEWVTKFASPENLAWEWDKFKDLRNLMRTRKAAANLRIQAVKIECVALRRIGLAGLEGKLPYENKKIAKQFAQMSDEDFEALIADCNNQHSPAAFLRNIEYDWHDRQRYYRGGGDWPEIDDDIRFNSEVRTILETLGSEGPFTVAEAAEKLFERIDHYHFEYTGGHLPGEFADEPLREVVRKVLMVPEPGSTVYARGVEITIPHNVTYHAPSGYCRIPWRNAMLSNYRAMVEIREKQAAELLAKANAMRVLLDLLDEVLESESMSADEGLTRLMRRGVVSRKKEQENG
jgi:hypothetical protein